MFEKLHGTYGPCTYKDWLSWTEGYYEILDGTFLVRLKYAGKIIHLIK